MLGAEITINITVHINDSLIINHFSDVNINLSLITLYKGHII
jgi:hypothetical protein